VVENPDLSLCLIGAGRVGSVLAYHFSQFDIPISSITEKNATRRSALRKTFSDIGISPSLSSESISQSDIIFICVPDDQLAGVVSTVDRLKVDLSKKTFVHTSGAYSSEILIRLRDSNGQIASAHPIYSFGNAEAEDISLEGVYFDLEGDVAAVDALKNIFRRVGIKFIEISRDQKIAVHIASVFYSNYLVGLTQVAQAVLRACGFPEENFWEPFVPLIGSTLKNLSANSPAQALTGPIKRGDVQTVEKHLAYLKSHNSAAVPAYVQMARAILPLASLPPKSIHRVEEILRDYDTRN
jgi:predicted short-subunit dehydrogenase-like oxidoreductase (DUF2520 family)